MESIREPALLVEGEPTAADWTVLDGNSAALKTLDMPRSTLQGTPLWGLFAMPSKVHTLICTHMPTVQVMQRFGFVRHACPLWSSEFSAYVSSALN